MPYRLAIPQYQLTPSLYYEIAKVITLVGKVGLEPTTALSTCFTDRGDTNYTVLTHNGGIEGNRTLDPLLARQMLSQLSYNPML